MTVLITGAEGFIGRHMVEALGRRGDQVLRFCLDSDPALLPDFVAQADAIFHLAGVNRPQDVSEFVAGNRGFTEQLADLVAASGRKPHVVFSSSTQAELDNPYGQSKLAAEGVLRSLAESHGVPVTVFRLTNVFGKWARPNYNSAVATFAHNIAKGQPIEIHDPARRVCLVYIDDVVTAFLTALEPPREGFAHAEAGPTYEATLQQLADTLYAFRDTRTSLVLPNLEDRFAKLLLATYTSYLDDEDREYGLTIRSDQRGSLAEFLKAPSMGQIFVSRTKPGFTRGNHYHHTKVEKFLVLEGEAVIRFRQIEQEEVQEHRVRGEDFRVVDITPGWTHSIENVGQNDLITLFWASEIFDPELPDTYFVEVLK